MNEAKNLMRRAQLHALQIAVTRQQLERMNLYRISPGLVEGGGHLARDRIGEGIAQMEQLREELARLLSCWAEETREAERLLGKLQDPALAEVLKRRYFLNQTWDVIADKMHYSRRGACYLHGRALAALDAVIESERQAIVGG